MYVYFGIKNELFGLVVGFLEIFRSNNFFKFILIGFIDNFLKVEKEHMANLNTLKSVTEMKYPF